MEKRPIRIYPNMIPGLIEAVRITINGQASPAGVLKQCFRKHPNWGARDRRLVGRLFYDWIRWWRLYQVALQSSVENPTYDAEKLLSVWCIHQGEKLPPWLPIESSEQNAIELKLQQASKLRSLKYSIPDWLDAYGSQHYGEHLWEEQLISLNQKAKLVLRVNLKHTTPQKLADKISKKYQVQCSLLPPEAIVLDKNVSVEQSEEYKKGAFEIQDFNSQQVAHWLAPQAGEIILDACAGGGGKSLHLASLMDSQGQVIAEDLFPEKLQKLQKRAQRNRIRNIQTIPSSRAKYAPEVFDRVLLDVPCSGLGVLRRNPAAKWQMTPDRIQKITALQQELLQKNAPRVKINGVVLYVSCSILTQENEEQIQKFLNSPLGQKFILEKEFIQLPSASGFDGFYGALLKRTTL